MSSITITRALVELKTLDDRINKAISLFRSVVVTKGRGERKVCPSILRSPAEVEANIKSSYQTIIDLIARRNKIKDAVQQSNATTLVKIKDVQMTVQQAIERKNSIKYDTALFERMRTDLASALSTVEQQQAKLTEQIEAAVATAYQGADRSKVTADQYAAVSCPRLDEHEPGTLDPLKVEDLLSSMSESINGFNAEVDFVLSESNARTKIDVGD